MADPPLRSAAIGLDHRRIHHQVGRRLELGCEYTGFRTEGEPKPFAGFLAMRVLLPGFPPLQDGPLPGG